MHVYMLYLIFRFISENIFLNLNIRWNTGQFSLILIFFSTLGKELSFSEVNPAYKCIL